MNKLKGRSKVNKDGIHFPVVGIGASAGGLEAISSLLNYLSPTAGMAYVYVQHQSPTHHSMLPELLARETKMKIVVATKSASIAPDHFYVIPPDKDVLSANGKLKLVARKENHYPIDDFFHSLAVQYGEKAIGVILSGSATDGTRGMKAIKLRGGITFAQDESAKFSSMPKSAIMDGVVDFILSPREIAKELERISSHSYVSHTNRQRQLEDSIDNDDPDIKGILAQLMRSTGVDFSHYKSNTIRRRILRRMVLFKVESLADYLKYIRKNKDEINLLYRDLLINVTEFFREKMVYEHLKKSLLPRLISKKKTGETFRIWVPACSTGEEVYSLAMILLEIAGDKFSRIPIQIFATDLSEEAINKARVGEYSAIDLANVSSKRIQRFFVKVGGKFRVAKGVRDLCVYAKHNVFHDPPFSRLDMISCCNLLIYLDTFLQKKALATFHYALNKNGYLVLGKSENITAGTKLFSQENKKFKIFLRKGTGRESKAHESAYHQPGSFLNPASMELTGQKSTSVMGDLDKLVDAVLLSKYIPACMVINRAMEILQFRGSFSSFLQPSPGKASLHLLKMTIPELALDLRHAISAAIRTNQTVKKKGIEIKRSNNSYEVAIEVVPLKINWEEPLLLVLFKKELLSDTGSRPGKGKKFPASSQVAKIKKLEDELDLSKEEMRSYIEGHETASEELQSANEEIVSSNEELQSVNEELETSKEELESANEELITANQQLQIHNEQLEESYNFSEAIISTMHEPFLILDKNLRIRKVNKSFYERFKVKPQNTEGYFLYEIGDKQWDITELRAALENLFLDSMGFRNFEVTHQFPVIGLRTMLLNCQKIVQKSQNEQLILLAIEDITELIKKTKSLEGLNKNLVKSNSELEQYAYIASHDLQEPLRKISIFSQRLRELYKDNLPEEAKNYLSRIEKSSQSMTKLVGDLLSFSHVSEHSEYALVDLNKVLKMVLKDFDLIIQQKGASVSVGDLPVVHAIPVQMNQLFHNLVSNALKFSDTSRTPEIRIESVNPGPDSLDKIGTPVSSNGTKAIPYIEITVQDNGIGFDEKFAEDIFSPFYRLHNKSKYEGTGIGLALCNKIVAAHRGVMYAKSTEKKGSVFHILLPGQ